MKYDFNNSESRQKRFYGKNHPPLEFVFSHNIRDFVVEEIPLYIFSGHGEHAILKIRKKNLSTHDILAILSKELHINKKEIGYAGLKDKNALTYQYISVPNKAFLAHQQNLLKYENLKILESVLHSNKIKIGHLKGNKFFVRLKKVNTLNFERLCDEFHKALQYGFPNFFGYQRFGNFGDNYLLAQNIKKPIKRQNTTEKLLISSLQSHYFNLWLEERLKLSNIINTLQIEEAQKAVQQIYNLLLPKEQIRAIKQAKLPFIPLLGDVCMHYPFGKLFYFSQSKERLDSANTQYGDLIQYQCDIERLRQQQISITGLLSGIGCGVTHEKIKNNICENKEFSDLVSQKSMAKVWLATHDASQIESRFRHEIQAFGTRRYAWVYPINANIEYIKQECHVLLNFELPSGSYATSFLEYLKNASLF